MQLNLYTYSLPFRQPFKTAAQPFTHRDGCLLELKKDNLTAFGEAAPLPGFSGENQKDVLSQLRSNRHTITDFFESKFTVDEVLKFTNHHRFYPSVQFAFITLGTLFLAQKNESSLNKVLQSTASSVPMNAVIGADTVNLVENVQELVKSGFNTVKIKVSTDWEHQFSELQKVQRQFPGLNIRIDANQSWSMQRAAKRLRQLETINIEYCEEPLTNPDLKSIANLTQETSVPIALDESIGKSFSVEQAMDLAPVLIIKPMVLGAQAASADFITKAKQTATKLVYTSSLDGGIGRLMTAVIAAKCGAGGTAHGLNTGNMLKKDFWNDNPFIKQGFYNIPATDVLSKMVKQVDTSRLQPVDL